MINLRGIQCLVVYNALKVNPKHLRCGSTSFLPVTGLHKCFKAFRASFEWPDCQLRVQNVDFFLHLSCCWNFHYFN